MTTLNGGNLPDEALSEAKARGLLWLANFNVAPVDDPLGLRARMAAHAGMTQARYDGFTSDELFFGRTTIDHYTRALWVNKPAKPPGLHVDCRQAGHCVAAHRFHVGLPERLARPRPAAV